MIDLRIKTYDWVEAFKYATPTDVRTRKVTQQRGREDVAEVLALEDGDNDGPDWIGLFRMTDGKFMVLRAWCDYTGWGCQESGSADIADTLADVVAGGLTRDERHRLAEQLMKLHALEPWR